MCLVGRWKGLDVLEVAEVLESRLEQELSFGNQLGSREYNVAIGTRRQEQ